MFTLVKFKRIATAAAVAAVLAGLLLTAVQQVRVVPVLLQAETYEKPAASRGGHETYSAEPDTWQHANDLKRTLSSAASNVIMAFGFSLLLGAAMTLSPGTPSWRSGLLWGLAGYAVFFVAPSLGLPPEIPGTEAAHLMDRQIWWLMTVVLTAAGLALLVYARNWTIKGLGVFLLGIPHLAGAPQPQVHGSTAPFELAASFVYATSLANFIFWLCIGSLLGLLYRKMA